jgi:CheY-like chemotaxis protein
MRTILLVDDSESIRELLAKALADGGYKVLTAADGKQAIRILTTKSIDLIVTDLYMPEADGIELIIAVRKMPRRPPVIAMSSQTGIMDVLHVAKKLGAKKILRKPFPPSDLLQLATVLLGSAP